MTFNIERLINARKDAATRFASKPAALRYAAIGCAAIALFVLYSGLGLRRPSATIHNTKKANKHEEHDEGLHMLFQGPTGEDRCFEPDVKERFGDEIDDGKETCTCPDPLIPTPRYNEPEWMNHHQLMADEIKTTDRVMDVMLIGDSITERWRGTRSYGQHALLEDMKVVFQSNFDRTAGGQLNGCAVGSSGDITAETLWHLKNGFLPTGFQPKIFFLLIGTNDLGRSGCSKKTTLMGILNIAEYLHTVHPEIPILFHGLLPRSDPDQPLHTLGVYWKKIMWINKEINKFAKMHKNWYYMDSASIFLQRNKLSGDVEIKTELVPDGLHPNKTGYELWGPSIVKNIVKILEK
ncbi:hypothetical protein ACA910_019667 [Epithemia clementina (nom. ined.)]